MDVMTRSASSIQANRIPSYIYEDDNGEIGKRKYGEFMRPTEFVDNINVMRMGQLEGLYQQATVTMPAKTYKPGTVGGAPTSHKFHARMVSWETGTSTLRWMSTENQLLYNMYLQLYSHMREQCVRSTAGIETWRQFITSETIIEGLQIDFCRTKITRLGSNYSAGRGAPLLHNTGYICFGYFEAGTAPGNSPTD